MKDPFADLGFESDQFDSMGFEPDPHQELQQNVDTLINVKQKLGQDTSIWQGVKDKIQQTADENNRLSQQYKPLASGVQQTLNTGAGAIGALAELPIVRNVAQPIQNAFGKVMSGAENIGGSILHTIAPNSFNGDLNSGTLNDIKNAIGNLSTIAGTISGVAGAKTSLGKVTNATGTDVLPDNFKKGVGNMVETIKNNKIDKGVQSRVKTLEQIESSYAGLRKLDEKSRRFNQEPRKLAAESSYLQGSVDKTGTIRTTQQGGALERLDKERITPVEKTVSDILKKENRNIPTKIVVDSLIEHISNSGLEGAQLKSALESIKNEVKGLNVRAFEKNSAVGELPVEALHNAKIATTQNADYSNPESTLLAKAKAKAYKTLVENNSNADIKGINKELSKQYSLQEYIRSLDGKKVEGGRLGKYASGVTGSVVGGSLGAIFGPVGIATGAVVGPSVAKAIKEYSFKKTFGNDTGKVYKSNIKDTPKSSVPVIKK